MSKLLRDSAASLMAFCLPLMGLALLPFRKTIDCLRFYRTLCACLGQGCRHICVSVQQGIHDLVGSLEDPQGAYELVDEHTEAWKQNFMAFDAKFNLNLAPLTEEKKRKVYAFQRS